MTEVIEREIVDAFTGVHNDGVARWTVMTRNPDGTLHAYLLPACTFDNLVAEYGFDAGDIDTLLKVAMLQLHIPAPELRSNAAIDAAAAAGFMRLGRPVTLGNSDSTGQARQAHMERIRWVEENLVRIVDPQPGQAMRVQALGRGVQAEASVDPYERLSQLKGTYLPDPEQIEERREELRQALGREV
ncbi:hypothetical protein ACQP1V_42785 (plasmid) [Microtetraspora malaysiensis]|uniref:hypothetical protein n=1 Tax=Microtetraspora malaysiensis TaxID=161358 RepID=UPI003D89B783